MYYTYVCLARSVPIRASSQKLLSKSVIKPYWSIVSISRNKFGVQNTKKIWWIFLAAPILMQRHRNRVRFQNWISGQLHLWIWTNFIGKKHAIKVFDKIVCVTLQKSQDYARLDIYFIEVTKTFGMLMECV